MSIVDHGPRQQAITALDQSVALAAGAGSGKTTVLTDRVCGLLRAGVAPGRIAAITFTEKAAGELRVRVRERIEQSLHDRDDSVLRAALEDFGELQLSTIHAFCRNLLLAEPLAAGWAPDTQPYDESVLLPLLHRSVRTWRRGLEERHPDAALLLRLAVSHDQVARAALALLRYRDLDPVVAPVSFDPEAALDSLRARRDAVEDAAEACLARETDKLLANNADLRSALDRWCSGPPGPSVARALLSPEKGGLRGGRKADWPGDSKNAMKDAVRAVRSWRDEVYAQLHGLLIRDMTEHLLPEVDRVKAEHAVALYDDLLFRARRLLLDHPDVRARLAEGFDAILIDEVQDTDPLQAEIAMLLARAVDQDGAWHAHSPESGRLFAVGDPKQSIYRFRRADVETWVQLANVVQQDGLWLQLRQNFRSVPGLVAWFNHTFGDMPGYRDQVAYRPAGSVDPVVALPVDNGSEEAEAIARHLWDLRRRGDLVQWSDVMILLPAWTHGDALQQTLATFDIPATIEGGRGFFGREEVQIALSAMKAIDEPADADALVHVLRRWFGVALDDLARHLDDGGAFRHTVPHRPAGPVGRALKVFSRLRRARMRLSWVHLLDQLMEAARVREHYALRPDGRACLANLDKLFHLIRELEAAGNAPYEVLDTLLKREDDDNDSVQSRDEPRLDAARITTIFKAKGLEAPFVVIARNQRRGTSITVATDRESETFALSLSRELKPPRWSDLKADERAAYDAERQRWMYVAATRAREQLVIPVPEDARSCLTELWLSRGLTGVEDGAHDQVVSVADGVEVTVRRWEQLDPPPLREGPFGALTEPVQDALSAEPTPDDDGTDWLSRRRTAIRQRRRASPRWTTATRVAHTQRVPAGSGTGLGNVAGQVIHDVLERLDLQRPLDLRLEEARPLMEAMATEAQLEPGKVAPCWEALERILHHDVFDLLEDAPEVWREVPFSFQDRGRLIHGVIDCCFPTDPSRRRWVVVDWKSDLPPPGSPAHHNYQRQIALYAKALLATVTPCEDVDARLVGPHPEIGVPDPDDLALDAVEEALRPVLQRLLAREVPMPLVGPEWEGIPIELSWEEQGVVVLLDPDPISITELEADGRTVIAVDTDDVDWAERVEDALREHFLTDDEEES